jgi:hypothetical protein
MWKKYIIFNIINLYTSNSELKNIIQFKNHQLQKEFNKKKEFYKNMLVEYLTKFTKSPKSFQEIKEVIIFLRNFYNKHNVTLTNKDLQFFLKKYTKHNELTTNFSNYLERIPYKENINSIGQYEENHSIKIINYNENYTEEFIEYQSNYFTLKDLKEFQKMSENESWYYQTIENKIEVSQLKFINRDNKYISNIKDYKNDSLEIINQLIVATKVDNKYQEPMRNFLLDLINLLMEIHEYHINEKNLHKNIKILDKVIERNGKWSNKFYFCFSPYLTETYLLSIHIMEGIIMKGISTDELYVFIYKENNDYYLYTILNDKSYIKNKIKDYKKFLIAYWTYLILIDVNIGFVNSNLNYHMINKESLDNKFTSILKELLEKYQFCNF